MTIHHAVLKKAAKHNITLEPRVDNEGLKTADFIAKHTDLPAPIIHSDPRVALDEALKMLGYTKPKRVRQPGAPKVKKAKGKKDKAAKAGLVSNKSVVKKHYKEQYKAKGSGQGNGDRLDAAMRDALEADENALSKIAKENSVQHIYSALNKGLQRMNLTNILRGRVKRGEGVKVLGKTIASL